MAALMGVLVTTTLQLHAQTSAFTYRGRLNDGKTLTDADLHGVALAAIQGLDEKVECGKRSP